MGWLYRGRPGSVGAWCGWVYGTHAASPAPRPGPAQPLAAVRSDACEAVPRKQCALTPVGSFAPSMALYGPATLPPPPPIVHLCSWGSGAGPRPRQEQEQEQERLGGRLGRGSAEQRSAPTTKPNTPNSQLPNHRIFESDAGAAIPASTEIPTEAKKPLSPRPPVVCRGAVRLGWWDPPPHGCGGGAYTDVLAACPANPTVPPPPASNRPPAVAVAPALALEVALALAPAPASAMRSMKKTYTTSKQARTGAKLRRCCGQGP